METTESGFVFAGREVTVVVCLIVVLWIDVTGMLVVRVETCTDIETWVMVDSCVKVVDWICSVDWIKVVGSIKVVGWSIVVESIMVVGWVVTCVVVLTSEIVVAKIEDDDVNSVLTKVVGIILVEITVVAKGIEREAGAVGMTWFLCAFLVPKTVARITMMATRKMMRAIKYLLFIPCFGL
jgi:hypothetical protein